jgi:hypothetical protein
MSIRNTSFANGPTDRRVPESNDRYIYDLNQKVTTNLFDYRSGKPEPRGKEKYYAKTARRIIDASAWHNRVCVETNRSTPDQDA